MTFSLRPYQEKIIADTRGAFADGNKSVLLVMPTGAGKTATCAWMIKSALSKGLPTWFLCHRKELVGQASKTFDRFGIPYGIIASGSQPTPYKPVQVCSIQTLVNRVDRLKKPGLVVYDEAHHMASASWSKVKDMLPDSFHLGLTATPERLDGKGLA
ncbi:DEAD/DEAH box helicase, partial [bacterium]|nr:DEAD/DEAH box helicase [bacterium]